MITRSLRRILTALTFSFISVVAAQGQAAQTTSWASAQGVIQAEQKVYVITVAHPRRRHACLVHSIDDSEIVCTHLGRTATFHAGDVAALIRPGEHTPVLLFFTGFLAAAGAATWGTVILAPICPVCAVATGVAAAVLYVMTMGSGFLADGDSADTVLYLAAGQKLQVSLR